MFAKWTYTYFDLVALIHIAPSVDLDINELISKVVYVLFCKMILRPYIQYTFGNKEDTEPWRYLN